VCVCGWVEAPCTLKNSSCLNLFSAKGNRKLSLARLVTLDVIVGNRRSEQALVDLAHENSSQGTREGHDPPVNTNKIRIQLQNVEVQSGNEKTQVQADLCPRNGLLHGSVGKRSNPHGLVERARGVRSQVFGKHERDERRRARAQELLGAARDAVPLERSVVRAATALSDDAQVGGARRERTAVLDDEPLALLQHTLRILRSGKVIAREVVLLVWVLRVPPQALVQASTILILARQLDGVEELPVPDGALHLVQVQNIVLQNRARVRHQVAEVDHEDHDRQEHAVDDDALPHPRQHDGLGLGARFVLHDVHRTRLHAESDGGRQVRAEDEEEDLQRLTHDGDARYDAEENLEDFRDVDRHDEGDELLDRCVQDATLPHGLHDRGLRG
jgi:hypothetical protein